MFLSIDCVRYNHDTTCNVYKLYDTCFITEIESPYASPCLVGINIANPITVYTIIKYYNSINRYVPANVARYYEWLAHTYKIDSILIKTQLKLLDKGLHTNLYNTYYTATIAQLRHKLRRLDFKH